MLKFTRLYLKLKLIIIVILISFGMPVVALETVQHVDLDRYLGKWYEIARFDVWFEHNCTNVTAEYSLNKLGYINVVNSCRLKSASGKFKQAVGRAVVTDTATNSKLKVSFLPKQLSWLDGIFNGNYWILKLEPDYSVVLVGSPSKEYLWILSRKPYLDAKKYEEYVQAARELGFKVDDLIKTKQDFTP